MTASAALAAYEQLADLNPCQQSDLLEAHRVLMWGLIESAGQYRAGGVGVMAGDTLLHMAPPANQVPRLMEQLFVWLDQTGQHPLIASSLFHYELEFIHPFADGNGRIGRLWQTRLLLDWQPLFANLPVESLVHQHQAAYYEAIQLSTAAADAAPFVAFMLGMIRDALETTATPQVAALLRLPALAAGLIEMTIPDKPQSRLQRYRRSASGQAALADAGPGHGGLSIH